MIAQYCACPIPLAALMFHTNNLPHREPVLNVRLEAQDMSGDYVSTQSVPRKSRQKRTDSPQAKLLSFMSSKWQMVSEISEKSGMHRDSINRALSGKKVRKLVEKKVITDQNRERNVWRLK